MRPEILNPLFAEVEVRLKAKRIYKVAKPPCILVLLRHGAMQGGEATLHLITAFTNTN